MKICVLIVVLIVIPQSLCFELITAGLVGLTSVVTKYTYCKLTECCTVNEIPGDFRSKTYF